MYPQFLHSQENKVQVVFSDVYSISHEERVSPGSLLKNPTHETDAISGKCWLHHLALTINLMDNFSEAKLEQRDYKSTV